MEARRPYFSNQFCRDIEREVIARFKNYYASLKSDFALCDYKESLQFIESGRIEAKKNLEGSVLKTLFSVKDIKGDIKGCLEKYFEQQPISYATKVGYSDSVGLGCCNYNKSAESITVRRLEFDPRREEEFDFSQFKQYEKLVDHLYWGLVFTRIMKLDAKTKSKKMFFQDAPFPKTNHSLKEISYELKKENNNPTFRHNKFSHLFNEGAIDLFYYLNIEYVKDDKTPKSKYSSIYHFLKYLHLIAGTQLEYIEFIESEMEVSMSKILPVNYKYDESILPLLKQLKSEFDRGNRNE